MRSRSACWFVLGLSLGMVLGMIVGYVTPALGVTEATLNVFVDNPRREIREDIEQAMSLASVVRLQEVWTPQAAGALRRALRDNPTWRASWLTLGTGNVILWNTSVWQAIHPARARLAHKGIPGLTPNRWLVWKVLRHRRTGVTASVADVHTVSGYCSGRAPLRLRERLARDYWDLVVRWTERQMRLPRVILLGGDFNCWLSRSRPLPRADLLPLYTLDRAPWYDHLVTARTPGAPTTVRRWEVPANSDHDLNLRRLVL